MASVGHVIVGAVAARTREPSGQDVATTIGGVLVWSVLSLLPDIDVVGFPLGIRYAEPWGHRGATHSLAFAVMVAAMVFVLARVLRARAWSLALTTLAVVASHPLLDMLTDGGLGCALWWPFSDQRFFAPWRPLPVAPIGRRFLSVDGLLVMMEELLWLTPLVICAAWPRRGPSRPGG